MIVASILFFALVYGIPILLIIYLFQALRTIVDGIRSINAATQRMAVAMEKMASEGSRTSS